MRTSHLALAAAILAATLTLGAAAASEGRRDGGRDHAEDSEGSDESEGSEEREHQVREGGTHHDGGRHDEARHDGGRRSGEGGDRHPTSTPQGAVDPAYAKECGACHLAYPPRLLPADSWRRMMAGLGTHFGQDAGLDEPLRARLEGWLVERAGPARAGAPQRITELAWFRDEHRKVPSAVVARPAVASLANCAACHQGAARWDFDEDRVRIPPG